MDLNTSLERILQSGDKFGDLFYAVFFERNPEAKQYFDGADMQRQSVMLTMSLKLMGEYYSNGYAAVESYLKHLGTFHSDRGVPREIYDKWTEALRETLSQFHGDDWNDDLAEDWRNSMDATTKAMFGGYERRVGL